MYMNNENLNSYLNKFWTPQKCGKVNDLAEIHADLLSKYLRAEPKDLFEQLAENTFKFKPMKSSWNDFLRNANLAEYLMPEYTEKALNIAGGQPAIGKGEFLFASCFSNIGFRQGRGDLYDMNTNLTAEFKGIKSNLSGYGNQYKQMCREVMLSIFGLFNTNIESDNFNRKVGEQLDECLKQQPDKIVDVMKRLQNIKNPDTRVARMFAKYYDLKPHIFELAGAQQLYLYMLQQRASYMVFSNDKGFCCCEFPKTPEAAYNIVTYESVKLSSWFSGENGFTIGI